MWKYIIYAIILILISNFPASFEVVKKEVVDLTSLLKISIKLLQLTGIYLMNLLLGVLVTNGDTTEYVNVF